MNSITIDFTKCKYFGDIHKVIKNTLNFPDYYGENLDALWDCLQDYCDYDLIYLYGIRELSEEWEDYIQKILSVFNMLKEINPDIIIKII